MSKPGSSRPLMRSRKVVHRPTWRSWKPSRDLAAAALASSPGPELTARPLTHFAGPWVTVPQRASWASAASPARMTLINRTHFLRMDLVVGWSNPIPTRKSPSMKLLDEIESDLLNSKPLADVLRKVIVLGGRAGSGALRDWASLELNGYAGSDEQIPPYRGVPGS